MRQIFSFVVVAFGGLLVTHSSVAAEDPTESFDVGWIDSYLTARVREKGRVGLSVAIVTNGQIALVKGYGLRSLQEERPVESDTTFAIGSVTKQFTCACVLLLAQEGKLSVDDKVSKYLPKLTRARDITLLDLMNHTSGYPDYYPLDFVDTRMQKTIAVEDLLQEYAGGRLDFEPGSNWSYSNTGFIILGRVVEKRSGRRFAEFLEGRILKPLGLEHTTCGSKPDDKNRATGYTSFALSASLPATPEAEGWLGAAGALCSTPSDLAKWDLALMEGKVLKPKFLQFLTTSRVLTNGIVTGYGCGLAVTVLDGRTIWRHNGAVSGFNAFNAMIPSTRSAVVVLCNTDGGLGLLPDKLLGMLLKTESNVPKVTGLTALEAVKKIFAEFQTGTVDRGAFGAEFNRYLSDEKLAGAAARLKALGLIKRAEVVRIRERGGLEVTTTLLSLEQKNLEVLMYRAPSGRVEQFFIDER